MRGKGTYEAGFSLLEAVIAGTILASVILVAFRAADANASAQRHIAARASLETKVAAALARISERIREAGSAVLDELPAAPDWSNSIKFRRLVDYDSGTGAEWGPEERIGPRNEELGDSILWESGPVSERLMLAPSHVSFSREGRIVRIEVTAEVQGPEGRQIRVRRSSSVCPRN
jgi:hypothetical protein